MMGPQLRAAITGCSPSRGQDRNGRTMPSSIRSIELDTPVNVPWGIVFEPLPGIEPGTPSLPWKCSTAELKRHCVGSIRLNPFTGKALERETRFELATLSLEG